MKIGTIINYARIELDITGKIEVRTDTHKVIGMNEDRFVIYSGHFQTIDFREIDFNMNPVFGLVKKFETEWGIESMDDMVQAYVYSDERIEDIVKRCKSALMHYIFMDEKVARYKPFLNNLESIGFNGGTIDTGRV